MALPLFAVTLFVSAFLLFLVQPMIGKMILPKLGGTPQVWNTCMLFFQCALLAGYAYTHSVSTRLPTRRQLMVHAVLLLLPLIFLLPPIGPFDVTGWSPNPSGIPVVQALLELTILVGVPFFVVSTSAPLLQKWFVNTGHPAASDPYFLYGASNLGSLLSLLVYPFFIEPWFALRTQANIWLGGYVALGALVVTCIVMVWKSPLSLQTAGGPHAAPETPVPPPEPAAAPPPAAASTAVKSGPAPGAPSRGITRKKGLKGHNRPAYAGTAESGRAAAMPGIVSRPSDAPVTGGRRLRWVLLAAVPSSLMLGVTSFISTDLSPFPLIWIVPLALYLLSFILVYLRWPIPWTSSDSSTFTPHSLVLYVVQPLCILGLCWILLSGGFSISYMFIAWAAFFATALACHGELARDRPTPRHLTEYFLLMSVGGALGGFLNAIVAPLLFTGVWEFYIALVVACFVRPVLLETNWLDNFLMNTFPSMQSWARDQSDQFSRSFGKTPDGSTYVLSYTLDILLGLFMVGLVFALQSQTWYTHIRAMKFLELIGFGPRAAELYRFQALYAVLYGIPLILCGLFSSRPVRFGLAITALLAVNLLWFRTRGEDEVLYQGRTYFGVLRVLEGDDRLYHVVDQRLVPNDPEEWKNFTHASGDDNNDKANVQDMYKFTYLMHGTTYHGRNYIYKEGSDKVDLSRLATTYYHRYGPVGVVMERFNWFPGPQNSYWGDVRLPAAEVGSVAATLGVGGLPYAALTNAWSEIPYATIGLGTGTMASYCRPYQHLTYYEIDKQIRDFSLPPPDERAFFTYLLGAIRRGGNVEVIMGDARLSMENPQITFFPQMPYDPRLGVGNQADDGAKDHPDLTTWENRLPKGRERYYRAINVDAFSSDAIPVHLVTIEAIRMYLTKLSPDGVLCVHTSNRHLDLVQIVGKAVEVLNTEFQAEYRAKQRDANVKSVKCMVGKDNPPRPEGAMGERSKFLGQFSSEYVMVYFDEKYLRPTKENYVAKDSEFSIYKNRSAVQWHAPERLARYPWTDDYSNLVSIMR